MRVVQVLTMVSSRGEFGGPQAVAESHAKELSWRGHSVLTVAARRPGDQGVIPSCAELRAFPSWRLWSSRVSALFSARLALELYHEVGNADVVHIHLARDLVPLAAGAFAVIRGTPFVVQTHGMVVPDARRVTTLVDRFVMRPLMRRARTRLALTPREVTSLRGVAPDGAPITIVPNAAPVHTSARASWGTREALFVGRLHPRKRVLHFALAATELVDEDVAYAVVGPDGGDLPALLAMLTERPDLLRYEGALAPSDVPTRMAASGVFVLPSRDEPFPMAVLEALSVGLPCVVTRSCAIADDLERAGAAVVVPDGEPSLLAAAVADVLSDRAKWHAMQVAGLELTAGALNRRTVGDLLEGILDAGAAAALLVEGVV
jgi:glycosyltransferase involved in cell wall biosynthesis